MESSLSEWKRICELSFRRKISFDGKQHLVRFPGELVRGLGKHGVFPGKFGHEEVEIRGIYRKIAKSEKKLRILLIF
ncbi:hypothetical protein AKJ45_01110 [candidate division MSBL1 archaeon SCGC-AAA261F19]|uniref:Uncharacterized protein n=2 Tax=candidate division MSBL1 TaxID=215777 RepID=A0A133VB48_9EURY|nr:hypothetical protein AKJ43_01300 [candidate division MSBL1 archaeon SCGC-AAA261D19]KXB03635.1 hypothetical protein AKJ45_01110 [candidate division MSBL1 archaeon SCGC-AAA261F19]